jgi:hypothetical protein
MDHPTRGRPPAVARIDPKYPHNVGAALRRRWPPPGARPGAVFNGFSRRLLQIFGKGGYEGFSQVLFFTQTLESAMNCPGCGVQTGRLHQVGCDCEQCPACGRYLVACPCILPAESERLRWDGTCSWIDSCLAFGFFEREVGVGWVPCEPDASGAQPDVLRLFRDCRWNRSDRRFER